MELFRKHSFIRKKKKKTRQQQNLNNHQKNGFWFDNASINIL